MQELQDALCRAHSTSAGPDEIHYQLLSKSSLSLLLNIFNKIWISGDFPSDWRKVIIIPIPKPGKDPNNPSNYHPIVLTSCICKSFKVWVESTFLDSQPQEMSVPQGSILAVTLFSVKINITQCLKPGVDCSLCVNDFQIYYRSSNMSITECQLQFCFNKLQQWAIDDSFQFSKTKTVCMHIGQKRGLQFDPQLFLDKSPIPVVEETTFLGVIFDRKLFFVPHLIYIKKKVLKALNI